MHTTLKAINFAENLVRFCIEDHGFFLDLVPTFTLFDNIQLIQDVATAVLNLIRQADDIVADCKKELEDMLFTSSPAEFARCALAAARFYFPKGYTHEAFLSYCAMVVGVVCLVSKDGNTNLARCASEVIGLVIIAHVLTKRFDDNGGYERLGEIASAYSSSVKIAKTKSKMKKKNSEE